MVVEERELRSVRSGSAHNLVFLELTMHEGGGWAGTQHFIDPTNGIALVFSIHISPYGVPATTKLWNDLESLVYSALNTGK